MKIFCGQILPVGNTCPVLFEPHTYRNIDFHIEDYVLASTLNNVTNVVLF